MLQHAELEGLKAELAKVAGSAMASCKVAASEHEREVLELTEKLIGEEETASKLAAQCTNLQQVQPVMPVCHELWCRPPVQRHSVWGLAGVVAYCV